MLSSLNKGLGRKQSLKWMYSVLEFFKGKKRVNPPSPVE